MAITDTPLDQLIINIGTKAQVDQAIREGRITEDMLTVVTDQDIYVVQVTEMPVASIDELGRNYQYVGPTTSDYTYGYFYKCVANGTNPETYSWEQFDVQPATELVWGNIEGDITNQTDLNTELTSLQDQIDSLSGRGRYLSVWNCTTGLAETIPTVDPYPYKTGDYFIVGTAVKAEPESCSMTIKEGSTVNVQFQQSMYKAKVGTSTDREDVFAYTTMRSSASVVYGDEKLVLANQNKFSELWNSLIDISNQDKQPAVPEITSISKIQFRWFYYSGTLFRACEIFGLDANNVEYQIYSNTLSSQVPGTFSYKEQQNLISQWLLETFGIGYVNDLYIPQSVSQQETWHAVQLSETELKWTLNGEDLPEGETITNYGLVPVLTQPVLGDIITIIYRTEKINYKPNGSEYSPSTPSTVVETKEVEVDDTYVYDGLVWHLLKNNQKDLTFTNIAGSPYDNTNLADALNSKVSKVDTASQVYGTDENGDQTTYALSEFHKGGWHEVSTVSDRDAISDDLLEVGMIVYVTSEAKGYILTSLNTEVTPTLKTWEEYKPGQGDYIRKITTYPISSVSPLVDGEIIQYQGPTVPPYWNGYFYKDEQKYSYISSKSSNMGPASINIIDESLLRNYIYRNQHAISGGWSDIKLVFSGTYAATVYATNGETEVQLNGFNSQEEFEHIGLHVSSSAGYPVSGTIAYIAPAHVWTQTDVQPQTDLIWGNITGTLSDQTDLQDALNVKQDVLTPGNNITIEEDSQTGDLVISSTAQESFFRGKWSNWTSVPTDTSRYPEDYNHNRVPTENDYMVVSDTSDYTAEGMEIKIYWDGWGTHRFSVNDSALVAIGGVNEWVSFNLENDVIIYIKDYEPRYGYFGIKCNVDMLVDGSIVPAGNVVQFIESQASRTLYYYVASGNTLSGTWRFAYHGVWSSIGKNGWLPEYQLEDVLPIATPTEQGIAKLYTNLGSNTDGAVDQATVTTELGKKQDVLTAGTGIDISTDASTGNLVISSTSSESFYRGTFNTWALVPTNPTNYVEDPVHHLKTPTNTDYMIVTDASDYYKPGAEITIHLKGYIGGTGFVLELSGKWSDTLIAYNTPYERVYGNNELIINFNSNGGAWGWRVRFNIPVVLNGVRYDAYDVWTGGSAETTNVFNEIVDQPCEGTWRFGYYGEWDTAGRNGWVAEYKIEDTLPIASDTVAGITKLYTTTGSNTDGAVDQATVTTELNKKQDVLTAGNNITIDANNRIDAEDKTLVSFVIWEDEE